LKANTIKLKKKM